LKNWKKPARIKTSRMAVESGFSQQPNLLDNTE